MYSLLLTLLLASTPVAKIEGPTRISQGNTIFLSAAKSVSDLPLQWKIIGDDGPYPYMTLDSKGREGVASVITDAKPGVLRIALIAIGTDDPKVPKIDVAIIEIVITDPTPAPNPNPDPPPGPAPEPPTPTPAQITGPFHVTLVTDQATDNVSNTPIRTAIEIQKALPALGGKWHHWDSKTATDRYGITPWVEEIGRPCLIFQKPDASKITVVKAPATEAEIIALIKGMKGVK